MNEWLAAAPQSTVVQSMTGCMVSLMDLADRPPAVRDGEVLDIGGHGCAGSTRLMCLTPGRPVVYDRRLARCSAVISFTQTGRIPGADLRRPPRARRSWRRTLQRLVARTVKRRHRPGLAELDSTLALMHGPTFTGDCRAALLDLADDYDKRIAAS